MNKYIHKQGIKGSLFKPIDKPKLQAYVHGSLMPGILTVDNQYDENRVAIILKFSFSLTFT